MGATPDAAAEKKLAGGQLPPLAHVCLSDPRFISFVLRADDELDFTVNSVLQVQGRSRRARERS